MAEQFEDPRLLRGQGVSGPANGVVLEQVNDALLQGGGQAEGTQLGLHAVRKLGQGT